MAGLCTPVPGCEGLEIKGFSEGSVPGSVIVDTALTLAEGSSSDSSDVVAALMDPNSLLDVDTTRIEANGRIGN